jgi:hypothetical protein
MWWFGVLHRRALVAIAAIFATVSSSFLVAAWFSTVEENRFQHAPTCRLDQAFSRGEACRITLSGTLTTVRQDSARLTVEGRRFQVAIHTRDLRDQAVLATFFRGRPIQLTWNGDTTDADGTPAVDRFDRLMFAAVFAVVPVTALALAIFFEMIRRMVERGAERAHRAGIAGGG